MKAILSILFLSFVVYTTAEQLTVVRRDLPKTCEDVLANDLCAKLREISAALKLQASKVDDAIKDALIKGLVNSPAVYRAAKEFLKNEVLDKTCEDFLAPGACTKLRQIAAALKIKAEKVEVMVREVIGEGTVVAVEVYQKVVEFMKNEVLSKTCEDFLAPRVCTKLREIAAKLKIKAQKVNELVVDALVAGYNSRQEIYDNVIKFFREEVLSLTCEDVLNTDLCIKMKAIAAKLKVKAEKVDKAAKEAILKGYLKTAEVIASIKDFYQQEVRSKRCEDFVSSTTCATLKALAARLKVRVEVVDQAVKDAIIKGYNRVREIYDYCVDYVKRNIQCEDFMSSFSCSVVRRAAKTVGVKIDEVEEFLRNLIASGQDRAAVIYSKVMTYIRGRIFG